MSWFGDLFLGTKPQYGYTDEQQAGIDWGMNYGHQSATEGGDRKKYRAYEKGMGNINFMQPELNREQTDLNANVENYTRQAGSGFSPGGGAYAIAGAARLRNEGNAAIARNAGSMYAQRGNELWNRFHTSSEDAYNRELQAHGIAAGLQNNPEDETRKGNGLLGDIIGGAIKKIPIPGFG